MSVRELFKLRHQLLNSCLLFQVFGTLENVGSLIFLSYKFTQTMKHLTHNIQTANVLYLLYLGRVIITFVSHRILLNRVLCTAKQYITTFLYLSNFLTTVTTLKAIRYIYGTNE